MFDLNVRWKPPIPAHLFHAEWYEVAQRNIVLSYQIATIFRQADKNIIEYTEPGQRLSLGEVAARLSAGSWGH